MIKIQQDRINGFRIAQNFWLYEFESGDTQEVKISPRLVKLLQKLRDNIGRKVIVNSGYRTPEHNRDPEVGGRKHSYHLLGLAADIYSPGFSVIELGKIAYGIGFSTVIIYPHRGIIHCDIREKGLGLVGG